MTTRPTADPRFATTRARERRYASHTAETGAAFPAPPGAPRTLAEIPVAFRKPMKPPTSPRREP